jgi:hypothetical protein
LDKDGLLNEAEFSNFLASLPKSKVGDKHTDIRDFQREILGKIDKN